MSKEWSTGLFSCFDDCMILLCGCCLPCHLNKYGLNETPCSDCCVHCWCSPCAVCQEARQLKAN